MRNEMVIFEVKGVLSMSKKMVLYGYNGKF